MPLGSYPMTGAQGARMPGMASFAPLWAQAQGFGYPMSPLVNQPVPPPAAPPAPLPPTPAAMPNDVPPEPMTSAFGGPTAPMNSVRQSVYKQLYRAGKGMPNDSPVGGMLMNQFAPAAPEAANPFAAMMAPPPVAEPPFFLQPPPPLPVPPREQWPIHLRGAQPQRQGMAHMPGRFQRLMGNRGGGGGGTVPQRRSDSLY